MGVTGHQSTRDAKSSHDAKPASATPFAPAAPPGLGLPKAGGALSSLGEKFQAGGPTGTGTFRVPIAMSKCRGVEPTIALEYDSGQSNGPYGQGWTISVPNITRRTDRGLPRYADAVESDVFILSQQEDLVPTLAPFDDGDYRVDSYRPRVEGLFARIERRTHRITGDAHWRTISADNVTSVFGLSPAARIANPSDPRQVFRWLLEATFDAHGHAILYEYKGEDLVGVARSDLAEATRFANPPTNTYLKRVHYGNRVPLTTRDPSFTDLTAQTWLFQLVLDYGEHTSDLPEEVGTWSVRPDRFSTFRAGFEIRNYRLCARLLMFHAMPEELGAPARLVKATELGFESSPSVTYLTTVRGVGYAWTAANQITVAYTPTLRLDYTRVGQLSTTVVAVDPTSLANAPSGLDDQSYQLVDLDGEGIPGILALAASPTPALYYKRNLGGGAFAVAERLPSQPAQAALAEGVRLLSLNSDGRLDVAMLGGQTPGFYERTRDFDWESFAPFASLPKLDWRARGVHLLDLDGDGLSDVLLAEDDVFVWYPSLARDGFGPPVRVTQAHDEDRGAALLTTDDYQTIFLADMSGDGLADIVRVRNGEIAYWPNLGYGRFGAKHLMRGAPLFDTPDLFDPRRIRIADIDGTGPSDIVYIARDGADVYFNQAGNALSDRVVIPVPLADRLATVRVADFLGIGTACLVWSSSDPADAGTALRYVDLLHSTKPHLLCTVANGLGAQTTITYSPSTAFYLADRAAGRPWATRLPFPVQTVARVQTTDAVAGTQFTFRYRYAHGFYDGVEREFRGFARVDTWDAEAATAYDLPPVHTVSWFHVGAWDGEGDDVSAALATEFYGGDSLATPLTPFSLPSSLLPPALREASRALKGRPLRQEIYGEDGSAVAGTPYSVTAYRYEVRELQPIGSQRHGVYHAFEREHIAYRYERDHADPRIEHQLALEVDPLGHVARDAHVAYARRSPAQPEQARVLATCGATTFAPPIATPSDFRHGTITRSVHYELFVAPSAAPLAFDAIDPAMTGAIVIPFDGALAPGAMRTIEDVVHQFWADDLSAPLPLGSAGARTLVYDHFSLACPASLVATIFTGAVTAADMLAAGYVSPDGDFWIHAGVTTYDPTAFDQATTFTDPFGNTASVRFDPLKLHIIEEHASQDPALDNVTTASLDYRVLVPSLLTDPNGNRSAAAYDELGMIVAVALMGRAGANEGDTLADPTTRLVYDLLAWEAATPTPASVHSFARVAHGSSNPGWFETYTYSDGSGHEVLKKAQAEPDGAGPARWTGTGRSVFDNKGNVIKKYEPYFAPDPSYDSEASVATAGYGTVLRYDPMSRLVRADFPDGTFATTTFDAWRDVLFDANDNVVQSAWYADASARPATDPLNRAAALAAAHANTPTVRDADALGRTVLVTADNGAAGMVPIRTLLDIQGNALAMTDGLGNVTVQTTYDARRQALRHTSADGGTWLALADGGGHPDRAWDPRGYVHQRKYDALRRMTQLRVTPPGGTEFVAEQVVYGEGLAAPNYRGRVYLHFDGAGVAIQAGYDFEGHVTQTQRQLAQTYASTPHWDALSPLTDPASFLPAVAGALEGDQFQTSKTYDAMNRVTSVTTHDQTTMALAYDRGNHLAAVTGYLRGATTTTPLVTSIAYNARGQRTRIGYGLGIAVQYTYDDRNQCVLRMQATRTGDGARLQDLNYTYDPIVNVVQFDDLAQATIYFAGNVTSGTQLFEYDAIYRLTSASGREQPGQVGYALGPDHYPEAPLGSIPHPNDLQALLAYTETYSYDGGGNLTSTGHTASGASWTRAQTYVPGSNRLDRASMPGDPATGPFTGVHLHDAAGNVVRMPHLPTIGWDHASRMVEVDLQGGGSIYYAYDSEGRRVRKLVARGGRLLERVYVDGYERYRERTGTSLPSSVLRLERETVHAHDGERTFTLIETKTVDASIANLVPVALLRFQFPNHIETALLETDEAGTPISYEEYYPYGGSSYRAGDVDKRYRFAGKERDEETGLYYFGARYYAPWLGRWLSPDPAGTLKDAFVTSHTRAGPTAEAEEYRPRNGDAPPTRAAASRDLPAQGSINAYEYCLDNPLAHLDDWGEQAVPLTTARLRAIARANGIGTGLTGVAFNREVGVAFETWVLTNMGLIPRNYITFPSPDRIRATGGARAGVIPEYVGPITRVTWSWGVWPTTTQFPLSSFYEVKAVGSRTITLSYSQHQIRGLIDVAARSPAGAASGSAHPPVPMVTFITTSDTVIGADVLAEASRRGVAVWQAYVFEVYDDPRSTPSNPLLNVGPFVPLNPQVYAPQGLPVPTWKPNPDTFLTSPAVPLPPLPIDPDPHEAD